MLITFVLYFLSLLLFFLFSFCFKKFPSLHSSLPNYPRQCVKDGAVGHMCFGHKCGGGWPRISASHNKFDPLPPPPPPPPPSPLPPPLPVARCINNTCALLGVTRPESSSLLLFSTDVLIKTKQTNKQKYMLL